MFCPKCGKEINDQSTFCMHCGFKINSQPTDFSRYNDMPQPEHAPSFKYADVELAPSNDRFKNQVLDKMDNINDSVATGPISPKSKTAAGLLAIFLGLLGIHDFYVGKTLMGVIHIVILFLTFSLGFWSLLFFGRIIFLGLLIWNVIDAVIFFSGKGSDGYGRRIVN